MNPGDIKLNFYDADTEYLFVGGMYGGTLPFEAYTKRIKMIFNVICRPHGCGWSRKSPITFGVHSIIPSPEMAIEKYASLSEPQFLGGAKKVIYHNNKIYFVGAEGILGGPGAVPWWYWDITRDLYTFGINEMINLSQQYQIPPYIIDIKPYQEDEIILGHGGAYGGEGVTIFSEREGVKRRFVQPEIINNAVTSIDYDDVNRIIAVGMGGGLTIIQVGAPLLSDVKAEPTIFDPSGDNEDNPRYFPLKISYTLSKNVDVIIKIFDSSGNQVKIFDFGSVPGTQGSNYIHWNGLDNNEKIVEEGKYKIYIYAFDPANHQKILDEKNVEVEVKYHLGW